MLLINVRVIDLDHNHFLILQVLGILKMIICTGEVESITQMQPKARTEHEYGLLKYLEDIIGISS